MKDQTSNAFKVNKKSKDQTSKASEVKGFHMEVTQSSMKTAFLHKPVFHVFLVTIIGFIAYSNPFHAPFQFDDTPNIAENPFIIKFGLSLDLSKAKELFSYILSNNRSIGYLSFALNYILHGPDVTGYHVVNLAVHIINALLLYWLVLLTFKTPFFKVHGSSFTVNKNTSSTMSYEPSPVIAFFASLLFVSHPIQTQAVTYIVQRFTSLATLFYLLSLVTYIKFRMRNAEVTIQAEEKQTKLPRPKSVLWYLASVISAVLAMRTKEIAFTLPLIIALYEFMFFAGKVRKRILYLIPLLLTMLIIPFTLLGTDKPFGDLISDVSEKTRVQTAMSRWDYLFTQFRVIVTYLRLLVFPANQNLDYDYPVYHSLFDLPVLVSFLFLGLLLSFTASLLRLSFQSPAPPSSPSTIHQSPFTSRYLRLISFGVLWFFIGLSVESSIIPIADVIFEHRVYLPSVGVFIATGTSIFIFAERFKHRRPWLVKAIIPALACVVIILLGVTYARNIVWQDDVSLWEDVVKKSPKKARARNNLGNAYLDTGLIDEAIEEFRIALRLKPDYPEAHYNLGNAHLNQGRIDEAIEEFGSALTLKPNYAEVHNNLGNAFLGKGWINEGIEEFRTALRLKPDYSGAHYNLGNVYLDQGRINEAIEEFRIALRLKPDYAEVHNNLGNAYIGKGRIDEAIKEFRIALRLKPDFAGAYYNLGITYARKGLKREAIRELTIALKINPNFQDARQALESITE